MASRPVASGSVAGPPSRPTPSRPGGWTGWSSARSAPDAAHELVTSRTPFRPGRRTLLNLVQLTGGNPMFLLELAGRPGVIESIIGGRPPDIPSSLRQLVASRISSLSARRP